MRERKKDPNSRGREDFSAQVAWRRALKAGVILTNTEAKGKKQAWP
jgi:hypothetical protein